MAPTGLSLNPRSSRLIYSIFAIVSAGTKHIRSDESTTIGNSHTYAKRAVNFDPHKKEDIAFAVLIPILVLLSGLFAGLTLGYMSLDQTQLNVLSVSGTPDQRKYANQIKPIRQHGHLLLVTLLLANMIVNETLPVIFDEILGGGFQSVVISTALIVIFAEIIPQSLFTRHGLYLGAKGVWITKFLIVLLGVVAWPVAKLLDWVLGSNHGIIYRRVELKELIAMHSSTGAHGGDLKHDTVAIIGATLDLQEKVVSQAMTPIDDVFMLDIESKLDYDLLKKVVESGHSRVPVYEEVDVPVSVKMDESSSSFQKTGKTQKVKKIIGIFLVKHCVLLDPEDATPLRSLQLNKVPFVPRNEPLLGILDKFQEGRSHMAIVSRFSVEKAKSVKKAVKSTLSRRLKQRVGIDTSDSSDNEDENDSDSEGNGVEHDKDATLRGDGTLEKDANGSSDASSAKVKRPSRGRKRSRKTDDLEMGDTNQKKPGVLTISNLEASMPADAVLTKDGANDFLQGFDPAIMPLGIITLEDVLEELIGEEIYDEFDSEGAHGEPYLHPPATATGPTAIGKPNEPANPPIPKPRANVKNLSFFRSRSAPGQPRNRVDNSEKGQVADDSKADGTGAAEKTSTSPQATADRDTVPPLPAINTTKPSAQSGTLTSSTETQAQGAAPIEAVLFAGKRRQAAPGTSSNPSTVAHRPGGKGGRFKSGPLVTMKRIRSHPVESEAEAENVAGDNVKSMSDGDRIAIGATEGADRISSEKNEEGHE